MLAVAVITRSTSVPWAAAAAAPLRRGFGLMAWRLRLRGPAGTPAELELPAGGETTLHELQVRGEGRPCTLQKHL